MAYRITLTKSELGSLAWCSARYESARILFDGMEVAEGQSEAAQEGSGPCAWVVPEHVARAAREAIAEDGGDSWEAGGFIPCLDSPAIRSLFDSIV